MSEKRSILSPKALAILRFVAAVFLNLGIVFSAVYILFHLLDYYNPHGFISHNMRWLPIAIPVLFVLSVLLYDLLLIVGAFRKHYFQKSRMLFIILCDVILFCALSLTMYLKTCTTSLAEHNVIEEYRLPTPVSTESPTYLPAPGFDDGTTQTIETQDPELSSAAPASTPDHVIPLESKFPEKYSDTPSVQSYDKSNIVETLSDGTQKALIYSYIGKNAAVDIYHYKKGKLEYQLADIYVRDINCFTTNFSLSFRRNVKTQVYASQINAIVSVNGDNFNSGKIEIWEGPCRFMTASRIASTMTRSSDVIRGRRSISARSF